MKNILILIIAMGFVLTVSAEFRTWKDKNGNSIEAEFVRKSGREIVLRDRQGKTHWIDPSKLSEEDQLYLNPPPKRYKIMMSNTSRSSGRKTGYLRGTTDETVAYTFAMKVEFLTDDAVADGLTGALFVMGKDENGVFVVLDKVEATVEMDGDGKGKIAGKELDLVITRDEDGKVTKGVRYSGYLAVLYAKDGTVLEKEYSNSFLENPEKVFTLEVGDRFNKNLEKIGADI